jgi:PKD domain
MRRTRAHRRRRERTAARRPGFTQGRRRAAAGAAAIAAAAIWSTPAQADYPVVSATIYPGASASVATRQVSASALDACPPYSGPSTMYMSPSGIDETVPTSSWAVSTVLTCGLQVPLANVSQVQVENPRGFEAPLTSADLATPSPYQDSSEQPLVSTDGSQDLNTYTRPWLGGSDENTPDQVTESNAPIVIVVYENGAILTVHPQGHIVSSAKNGMAVDFSAAVDSAQGQAIPSSALAWSWSFGDAATSTAAAPAHTYASTGDYYVSVQVADHQNGSGGTATFEVIAPATPARGKTTHGGAGHNRTAQSPAGPTRTSGKRPEALSGHSRSSGASSRHPATTPAQTQAPLAPTTPAPAPAATTSPTHRPPAQARRPSARPPARPTHGTAAARKQTGQLVSGRLVGDVVPLAAAESPLVRTVSAAAASAPPVRRATQAISMTGLAAGIAVALLLGLGAAREARGRRSWPARQP